MDTLAALLKRHITEHKLTRRQVLAALQYEAGSLQNVTRWLDGDIRNTWVAPLGRLVQAPGDVMARELAERLVCPLPTALTLAGMVRDGDGTEHVLATALRVSVDRVSDWCAQAVG